MLKKYQKQREEHDKEMKDLADIESKEKLDKFMKTEGKLVCSTEKESSTSSKNTESIKDSLRKMSVIYFYFSISIEYGR